MLAVALLIAGALWAFVALAAEMIEGDLQGFDEAILLALRNPADHADPIGPGYVETAMRDLTALGGFTVLGFVTLAVAGLMALRRKPASALVLLAAVAGGQLLSHLAKFGFSRPRPDLVPHGVEVVTLSFPSGHSMMATTTYLTLAVMFARVESSRALRIYYLALAVLLAIAVGVSRVYLGVHWPSDVLGGWTLGGAWALGCYLVAVLLGREGRIEPEGDRGEGNGGEESRDS
ncbi:phosphatase PAP2 family protein [Aquicoccus sp. SCR17]|nr:phosphatase PAP2 family protein [Carideicomes alvinocaridis]